MHRPTREQFERLVREHHAAVHRAARRLGGDDAAAADVAQEVFVRVLTGKEHLAAAHSERATLCWLATRLAANARRASRRRSTHEENAMTARAAEDRQLAPDPVAASERTELQGAVLRCVGDLPSELRLPLLLRCQDELTLAAIGTALRLPISTVRDRVDAALQRLRTALAGRGHAVAVTALPRWLAEAELPPVPMGLQDRLLELGSGAGPVAVGLGRRLAIAASGLGAIGALVLAVQFGFARETPPAAPAVAGLGDGSPFPAAQNPQPEPHAVRERVDTPVPTATPQPPTAPPVFATFTGVVRDADAWPVAGAEIDIVAGGGFKAFAVGDTTTTDARGAFTIHARTSWLTLHAVRLIVRESGRELLQTGDLVVPRPADANPLELVLPAEVGTATSRYECTVRVRDEAGQPLAGAQVSLSGPTEPNPRPGHSPPEAHGTTGVDGSVVLAGRGLGGKWLFVDGRPLQRCSSFDRIDIDRAGQHERVVTLVAGAELTVRVMTVSGRELEFGEPWLELEGTGFQVTGQQQPDGTWRFRGLQRGPFTVHTAGDGRTSPAAIRGVTPSAELLTIRLKECDDERDVGDHMAELHGTLVDAKTGELVPYGPFEVDVMPHRGDGSSLVFDGIEPPAPVQSAQPSGSWTSFHRVGLTAGRHAVLASVKGYAVAAEVVELGEREVRTGLRIALHRQAVVRGKVVDANGQPLAGATLFAIGIGPLADAQIAAWRQFRAADRSPSERSPGFHPVAGWSGSDGGFEVARIPPGVELRLVARHDEHGLVVMPLPELRSGDVIEGFDVRLPGR
jgi:RNA polymerase sigma-70 factor (ECF subfamily)